MPIDRIAALAALGPSRLHAAVIPVGDRRYLVWADGVRAVLLETTEALTVPPPKHLATGPFGGIGKGRPSTVEAVRALATACAACRGAPPPCHPCLGKGKVECEACLGQSRHSCDCPDCTGTHDCDSCEDGTADCQACGGTGKAFCPTCCLGSIPVVYVGAAVVQLRLLLGSLPVGASGDILVHVSGERSPVTLTGDGWAAVIMPVRGVVRTAPKLVL